MYSANDKEIKIAIHQPNYIPWLGYFYKIWQADVFVFLDDVQYSNKGMHNYHYLKTPQGLFRLKIPVKQSFGDKINEVTTKDEFGWKEKHLKIIETNYKKSRYFEEVFSDFQILLQRPYVNLAEMNIVVIKFFCGKLKINCNFIKSSDLSVKGNKTEKIIGICKNLGATTYYSGQGARIYQSEEAFFAEGIKLEYSEYLPIHYQQLWDRKFQSNVTVLDFLMNHGYDWNYIIEKTQ